jgi:hypothetical protein
MAGTGSVLFALLCVLWAAGPAEAAEPDPERDLVLAYYYPWYIQGDWSRHGYDGTPTLGKYGTDDPAVAEQHVRWGRRAGLDGFIVSWWGPDHLADRHFRSGYLRASSVHELRFAFIYESLGRLDTADGRRDQQIDCSQPEVLEVLFRDLAYLRDNYFSHRSYLKIGDRPLVVLYVSRTFRHLEAAQLAGLRQRLGVDLFLIGDEAYFGRQTDPATARNGLRDGRPLFEGYTAYNMFENARVQEGESARDFIRREALPIYRNWSEKTNFCPGLLPRYRDFRGHRPLRGTPDEYRRMIADLQSLPGRPVGDGVRQIYLITSFNEWWEGTTIEPATEYGTGFLDATRTAFGR